MIYFMELGRHEMVTLVLMRRSVLGLQEDRDAAVANEAATRQKLVATEAALQTEKGEEPTIVIA